MIFVGVTIEQSSPKEIEHSISSFFSDFCDFGSDFEDNFCGALDSDVEEM